jgi:DNA-binding transcriptional MerR regulator
MTRRRVTVAYPLLVLPQTPRLSLASFADRAGLHPDLIARLVALGLVPATVDATGQLWFWPADLAVIARIRRLRTDLSLNYAAIGLVLDLLDRIHQLENTPPRSRRPPPWT